jgi:hypothetical protein
MPDADHPADLKHAIPEPPALAPPVSCCIDWYSEGEARAIDVNGVRVVVRFIGRRGRRARLAITAPAGAVFRAVERGTGDVTG